MELITWNDSIATAAARLSESCIFRHGAPLSSQDTSVKYGENIHAEAGRAIDLERAINAWHNERSHYDYDTARCAAGKTCGHYTQMVWAATRQIGCSIHRCEHLRGFKSPQNSTMFLVCNYLPMGNVQNQKAYVKGEACSKCGSGSGWCWEGLCNGQCSKAGDHCECKAVCYNCAKLDKDNCRCSCVPGFTGPDCGDLCTDTHDHCTGNPGWNNKWCADETRTYVRQSCPVMCGLCVPDERAVADRCPPVRASKTSPAVDNVRGSRPASPEGKSPTDRDKDEEGESEQSHGEASSGYLPHQHPSQLPVMLLLGPILSIINLH